MDTSTGRGELTDSIVTAFADLSGFGADETDVIIAGLRALVDRGGPASLDEIAGRLDTDVSRVRRTLDGLAEWGAAFFDDEGRVLAMAGLGVVESPHRFEVAGRPLYAWCALDTLYLVDMLGVTARITSTCADGGEAISFTAGERGIENLTPPQAVISVLLPQGPITEDVRSSFCHFVNFFASEEAGRRWMSRHADKRFKLLPVGEALEWMREVDRAVFRDHERAQRLEVNKGS